MDVAYEKKRIKMSSDVSYNDRRHGDGAGMPGAASSRQTDSSTAGDFSRLRAGLVYCFGMPGSYKGRDAKRRH